MGGMMMGGGQVPNLKTLDPEDRVQSIDHCGDTYKVATADGKVRDFWEPELTILKTDVSGDGPAERGSRHRRGRDDGRPRGRHFRSARRDQQLHLASVLRSRRIEQS